MPASWLAAAYAGSRGQSSLVLELNPTPTSSVSAITIVLVCHAYYHDFHSSNSLVECVGVLPTCVSTRGLVVTEALPRPPVRKTRLLETVILLELNSLPGPKHSSHVHIPRESMNKVNIIVLHRPHARCFEEFRPSGQLCVSEASYMQVGSSCVDDSIDSEPSLIHTLCRAPCTMLFGRRLPPSPFQDSNDIHGCVCTMAFWAVRVVCKLSSRSGVAQD
ncbi:hypothetical protein BJY04DRAFT_79170 [Aspergillus karnatakaensis]|uniref:uncharacterized protein n=1 Tax=Aspergillus karnatakaensis TaxID=1810916 RepID=UPI003CCD060E